MRLRHFGLLLSGVVIAASGCSADVTGPSSLVAPEPAGLARSQSSAAAEHGNGNNGNAGSNGSNGNGVTPPSVASYAVTIDPTKQSDVRFGEFTLSLPANAICAPEAGYGPGTWNKPCATIASRVTIVAIVTSVPNGLPRIDLAPDMRFNPNRAVTLSLSVPRGHQAAAKSWRMLYCPTASNASCVDESLTDPTLATHVARGTGTVFRRIKHFSGYWVAE